MPVLGNLRSDYEQPALNQVLREAALLLKKQFPGLNKESGRDIQN
jgi:hypothetical protein